MRARKSRSPLIRPTARVRLYTQKTVVQKVEDSQREISLAEARKSKKDAALEDILDVEFEIQSTGRIAAQTAKQVVLQRLREAERELVYEEYAEKEGDIVTATVQRADSRQVTLDLGRTEAILPTSEQVMTERYRPGQKLKVHVAEVRRSSPRAGDRRVPRSQGSPAPPLRDGSAGDFQRESLRSRALPASPAQGARWPCTRARTGSIPSARV